MSRLIPLLLVPMAFAAQPPAVNTIRLNGHNFTLPAGFTIELVAESPLVLRPIMADFDEQGRLYVADSSGSNDKPEVQLRELPHRIVRFDPAGSDGIFHRSIEFADKMMFPEGVLWHDGSLYVGAPPSIWKLTDTQGGGAADKREEWFKGKTLTGCANDMHGPYLGPDGRLYWCKGAFAKQTHERPGREPIVTRAAHIFRAKIDGSDLETVMTGGMDNPVEVAWSPSGERFFTTTFIQHPGGGKRDAIVHSIYGGVYGKDHDVFDGHPRTSPNFMPVMTHLGPAAPSGLCRYESTAFGDGYRDNLFAALFNVRKVTRHVLVPDGATFKTIDSDFVVSDAFDFHPTDVLEDADGSLLVIDTGGWYKLCCPTAQLAKPDVLGAIYRVRRLDAPRIDDPRGLKLDWSNPQVEWLDDPRPAVRKRAITALAKSKAIGELAKVVRSDRTPEAKRNAVWALTRIDSEAARSAVRAGLVDADESVVMVALHSASVCRDSHAVSDCRGWVEQSPSPVKRVAAEAIGRIGDRASVSAITNALMGANDGVLEHSLIFSLIELGDVEKTATALSHPDTTVRRAALIALDQMRGGKLEARFVIEQLSYAKLAANVVVDAGRPGAAELRSTASWILGRHPEWAEQAREVLKRRLRAPLGPEERDQLVRLLSGLAHTPPIQALLAEGVGNLQSPIALSAMRQSAVKKPPPAWVDAVMRFVRSESRGLPPECFELIRGWTLPPDRAAEVTGELKRIARSALHSDEIRMKALAALPPGALQQDVDLERWLFERVKANEPLVLRSPSADILARGGLSIQQQVALIGLLPQIGAMELERVLDAFTNANDEQIGERLLEALAKRKADLRVATLRPRFAKFSPSIRAQAEKLFLEIDAESAKQLERLEKMVANLKSGDVRRGQTIFNGQKAACSACHAVGYLGGNLGPDLTRIGAIRNERDLLESIVFPNASFVRGYEPVSVMTKRGVPVNGLLKRETSDELEIATSATETVRIPREQVESVSPGTVSIMPAGFDQQLTERDFSDLLAFLKTCK